MKKTKYSYLMLLAVFCISTISCQTKTDTQTETETPQNSTVQNEAKSEKEQSTNEIANKITEEVYTSQNFYGNGVDEYLSINRDNDDEVPIFTYWTSKRDQKIKLITLEHEKVDAELNYYIVGTVKFPNDTKVYQFTFLPDALIITHPDKRTQEYQIM